MNKEEFNINKRYFRMDSSIKVLIYIIVVLFIAVYILFNIVLGDAKEDKKINENPSSIQERRDALKKMFN